MPANRDYGRTTPGTANILPELVFDLSKGQEQSSNLGKTETPVHLLPELSYDLLPAGVPVLQLSLSLRPGATPGEVALDLFQLYAAVNRLELSYRGAGLTPQDSSCEVTPTGGQMRVTFKPADPVGAVERLTRLVRTINGVASDSADVAVVLRYASIERCEAQLVESAA